jgi:hypothetical protein
MSTASKPATAGFSLVTGDSYGIYAGRLASTANGERG